MQFDGVILANFGGPRSQEDIFPFLKALLCDQDVVRTGLNQVVHNFLFTQIAKKRTRKVQEDYQTIGGNSPIYFDTLRLKHYLKEQLGIPVYDFHRYLPSTHSSFIKQVNEHPGDNLLVLPLFPQFSYATTGSCARFFETHLCGRTLEKLQWIPSYEAHPSFIEAYIKNMKAVLIANNIKEDEVCFFYSFHGVPRKFICFNDPYQKHCQASFEACKGFFKNSDHVMAFQSKFGKGEWLKPYTIDLVEGDLSWLKKKHVVFVPLSFTSDHIETLFEIETEYRMPLVERGVSAFRTKAISDDFSWAKQIILSNNPLVSTAMCVRHEKKRCCNTSHNCCKCVKNKMAEKKTASLETTLSNR